MKIRLLYALTLFPVAMMYGSDAQFPGALPDLLREWEQLQAVQVNQAENDRNTFDEINRAVHKLQKNQSILRKHYGRIEKNIAVKELALAQRIYDLEENLQEYGMQIEDFSRKIRYVTMESLPLHDKRQENLQKRLVKLEQEISKMTGTFTSIIMMIYELSNRLQEVERSSQMLERAAKFREGNQGMQKFYSELFKVIAEEVCKSKPNEQQVYAD